MASDGLGTQDAPRSFGALALTPGGDAAELRVQAEEHAEGSRPRRAAGGLAVIEEVTAGLLGATTEEAVAEVILGAGKAMLGASSALILLLSGDRLVFRGAKGVPSDSLAHWQNHPVSVPTPISDAVRLGTPIFLETASEWAARYPDAALTPLGPRGARIALPLVACGRVLGGIGFTFSTDIPFTEEDRALATMLARQCALALDRARLFEAERRARAELAAATRRIERRQRTVAALAAASTPEEVARAAMVEAREAIGASRASLVIPSADGERLELLGFAALATSVQQPLVPFPVSVSEETPAGLSYRTRMRLLFTTKAELAARFPVHGWRPGPLPGTLLCVPLRVRGRVLGVAAFAFEAERAIEEDGQEIRFVEELADQITPALDRALLDEAYRHERRTLDALVKACPLAISLLDLDGTVRIWNPAAERLFGWTAEEAVGRFAPPTGTSKREEIQANLARIAAGEVLNGIEAKRFHKNGHTVDVAMYAAPIHYDDGSVQCISISMDISERKRADEELRRAYELAREADRRKDEFLALLGHELRNPLSPILTALYLMRLRGNAGAEREREVIERQVNHLVSLVDDLLDVSRITRGKIKLETRPTELGRVIARAIEMASPLLEQKRHKLTIDVPSEGFVAALDETRMAQVLANLLTNAAKYTDAGGTISIHARREKDRLRLTVRDNGIGIAPELLPVIFDLFVQGERGADRAGGGLGLGLGLVQSLVALHGGEVKARSEGPGKGSEFEIDLPACSDAVAREDRVSPVPTTPSSVRRVLVVDDNVDAARLLGDVLASHGHEVIIAHDGPRALALSATFLPEIAILDIGLPVMDGYELAAELQAALGKTVKLVAVTGYGQEHDKHRAFQAGFSKHYVKPVDTSVLLKEVFIKGC